MVFDLLQNIVSFTPPLITADNYESAVSLANDFASAGSVGVAQELKRDSRRSKVTKQPKTQYVFFPGK
jgi:brefeldin A-resistance guanine nucleotide exchange factor 1